MDYSEMNANCGICLDPASSPVADQRFGQVCPECAGTLAELLERPQLEPEAKVELLREVQRRILEQPKRFNMEVWLQSGGFEQAVRIPKWDCQTLACIAGHALILLKEMGEIRDQEFELLNARYSPGGIVSLILREPSLNQLFTTDDWPLGAKKKFWSEKLEVTAARMIDWWISQHE